MGKCPNCGKDVPSSANFCNECGARLSPKESAPRTQGRKKKFWKKAAVPALVLIAAVLLFKWLGQAHSCPTCNEILDLQQELQTVLAENEDNSLTFNAFDQWNIKVSTLSNEIQLLKDHACDMPVRNVKDQEYAYGRYAGRYTGEWKSTAPCGEGVFSGSYTEGSTQYTVSFSGEWSGGAPNGAGSMFQHREYLDAGSRENWNSSLYEGDFVNGKLTGSGWHCIESSTGERYEFYDGVYRDGFLEGQANFLQYRDGELYDQGVVEGLHFFPVYSVRQEIENALNTAAAVGIAALGAVCLWDMFKAAVGEIDPNSSAGKFLERERASWAATEKMWKEQEAERETERQLYDRWQSAENTARWFETSSDASIRAEADIYYGLADDAKRAYDAF